MAFEIHDNADAKRFELELDGKIAFTAYALFEGGIEFKHTEVPKELEGKGIGSALAQYAFDYAKAHHLAAAVSCPFIKNWRSRHPG